MINWMCQIEELVLAVRTRKKNLCWAFSFFFPSTEWARRSTLYLETRKRLKLKISAAFIYLREYNFTMCLFLFRSHDLFYVFSLTYIGLKFFIFQNATADFTIPLSDPFFSVLKFLSRLRSWQSSTIFLMTRFITANSDHVEEREPLQLVNCQGLLGNQWTHPLSVE